MPSIFLYFRREIVDKDWLDYPIVILNNSNLMNYIPNLRNNSYNLSNISPNSNLMSNIPNLSNNSYNLSNISANSNLMSNIPNLSNNSS